MQYTVGEVFATGIQLLENYMNDDLMRFAHSLVFLLLLVGPSTFCGSKYGKHFMISIINKISLSASEIVRL